MQLFKTREPKGPLLKERKLENGLTLYFYDESRRIAGDRMQVELLVRVPVAVDDSAVADPPQPREEWEKFKSACGGVLFFQKEKVRNFIDQRKAGELLHQMVEEVEANLGYLSKPHFARKFILSKYGEWSKSYAWQAQYFKGATN
jgi:hypothetical protein